MLRSLILYSTGSLAAVAVVGTLDSLRLMRRWGLSYHAFLTAGAGTALMLIPIVRAVSHASNASLRGDVWLWAFTIGVVLTLEGWIAFGVLVYQWRRGQKRAPSRKGVGP